MDSHTFGVSLTLLDGYRFRADFGMEGVPPIELDEPPPLGAAAGPNPARLLAAAVGNCLAASLLYCLKRAHIDVQQLEATVDGTMMRNEHGRLRIGSLDVRLTPVVPSGQQERTARCLELFEDFCVVTQSVRSGLDVNVDVRPTAPAETEAA
jgi:organic hydroperoxide reductase OsmC/OhrA